MEQQKSLKHDSAVGSDIIGSNHSHIISLVMHPYQLVKDHRTGFQSSDIDDYLNGGKTVTDALQAYLFHLEKELRGSLKPPQSVS